MRRQRSRVPVRGETKGATDDDMERSSDQHAASNNSGVDSRSRIPWLARVAMCQVCTGVCTA
jgi:hypothetical protein